MSPINLVDTLSFAQNLALESGSLIKNNLQIGISRDWKSDHTPVTKIDKEINRHVITKIHSVFPTHNILGEEESDLTQSSEYTWVCDPLDGTFPFIHGIPTSTFVLALTLRGNPIIGVIYDPFTDRLFSAAKGKGATLNNQPLKTNNATSISNQSIGVVFWKEKMTPFDYLLPKLVDQGGKIFNLVSIAYMDAMVACGEFVATIFPGESPHDGAAAKVIIEEAGGIFTPLTTKSDRYDQKVHGHLACANKQIYTQIHTLLG